MRKIEGKTLIERFRREVYKANLKIKWITSSV